MGYEGADCTATAVRGNNYQGPLLRVGFGKKLEQLGRIQHQRSDVGLTYKATDCPNEIRSSGTRHTLVTSNDLCSCPRGQDLHGNKTAALSVRWCKSTWFLWEFTRGLTAQATQRRQQPDLAICEVQIRGWDSEVHTCTPCRRIHTALANVQLQQRWSIRIPPQKSRAEVRQRGSSAPPIAVDKTLGSIALTSSADNSSCELSGIVLCEESGRRKSLEIKRALAWNAHDACPGASRHWQASFDYR